MAASLSSASPLASVAAGVPTSDSRATGLTSVSALSRPTVALLAQDASIRKTPSSMKRNAVAGSQPEAEASIKHLDGAASKAGGAEITDTSAFMSDLSSLIKLVDSRDIVELELKHANYEILIRKKEALAASSPAAQSAASATHQTFPGPHVMAHTAFPYAPPPMPQVAPPPAAPAPPPPPPAPTPAPAAAKPASSLPPMLSPMAGTFYRSPAPGEPSFVKVGDRINKGQVVCIIEAMKLMNEIEADQSGIIAEILAEDGKPVSIESPLFLIQP